MHLEFNQQGPVHPPTHLTLNPSLHPDFCLSFQSSRHTSTIHWLIHPFIAYLFIYSSIHPSLGPLIHRFIHPYIHPSIQPFNHLYSPLSSHPTYKCGSHLSNHVSISSCPTVHPPDSLIQPNIHEQIMLHRVALLTTQCRVMSFLGLYNCPYSGENAEAPGSHIYWR